MSLVCNIIKCSIILQIKCLSLSKLKLLVICVSWCLLRLSLALTLPTTSLSIWSITILAINLQHSFEGTVRINNVIIVSCTIHAITKRTLIISLLVWIIVNCSDWLVALVAGIIKCFNLVELLFLL
jgi:hypothetical protein